MSAKPNRLYFLDSLRGIAAIMVASAHFIERTPLNETWFFNYVNFGQIGVVAFFVLSGMVIPFSLKSGNRSLLDFCISRFFRLYPAYWFSIALAVFTAFFIYGRPTSVREIIINMTMLQSLLGTPDLFGVYWTLIIEIIFYAMCSFLFIFNLLNNKNITFLISIILLIVAVIFSLIRFHMDKKIPVAMPLCLSIMFFGSFWRDLSLGVADRKTKTMIFTWLSLFFILLIPICFLAYNRNYGHGESAMSYIVSYSIGIILTLLLTTKVKIQINSFVFLGTISYSVYLVHQFFLEIASKYTDMSSGFNLFAFTTYLVSVVIFSSVLYFYIEKPSINIGRLMINR